MRDLFPVNAYAYFVSWTVLIIFIYYIEEFVQERFEYFRKSWVVGIYWCERVFVLEAVVIVTTRFRM